MNISSLDMSSSLILGNHCSFRCSRTLRTCFLREQSNVELVNEHDEIRHVAKTKSFKKDNVANPNPSATKPRELPPLVSALKASAKRDVAGFHFPGHNRGHAAPWSLSHLIGSRPFFHDLSSITELDNLFAPMGPILDAQKQAAGLFGAGETWFLVGGTTCGIQAAVMATCSPGDTLILPRNCHISAISAMVLSGAIPKYIIPEYDFDWDIARGITLLQVEKAINELEMEGRKASAVLVTSPTYHGIFSNLEEICQLCHSYDIPVIVDEAHGAHLGFHPKLPRSALRQGADLAVQSTHKVLCSLTQSSMLHMSGDSSLIVDREAICRCLQTLQSTSPSYLLLASLDAARAQLSENSETLFDKAIELAGEAKTCINEIPGICVLDSPEFCDSAVIIDPLRITVGVWQIGLSGFEADEILDKKYGIVSELTGTRSITFAMNLGSSREDVGRLVDGFRHLSQTYHMHPDRSAKERPNFIQNFAPFEGIRARLSPREAFFARKRKVSAKESVGEISGEMICPYPPGIPLMIPGEVITERALNFLLKVKSEGAMISGATDPGLSSIVVCSSA